MDNVRICDNHYVLPGGKVVCESNYLEEHCTRKNDPAFLCPVGMAQPNHEQWKRTAHDYLYSVGRGQLCNCHRCQPDGKSSTPAQKTIIKTVDTFEARIYVGFLDKKTGIIFTNALDMAQDICQRYVDKVGLCVTVTPTEYVYTNDCEPGCIVGLINYPRFPTTPTALMTHAYSLASLLKTEFRQEKVTIVTTDKTVMICDEDGMDQ